MTCFMYVMITCSRTKPECSQTKLHHTLAMNVNTIYWTQCFTSLVGMCVILYNVIIYFINLWNIKSWNSSFDVRINIQNPVWIIYAIQLRRNVLSYWCQNDDIAHVCMKTPKPSSIIHEKHFCNKDSVHTMLHAWCDFQFGVDNLYIQIMFTVPEKGKREMIVKNHNNVQIGRHLNRNVGFEIFSIKLNFKTL